MDKRIKLITLACIFAICLGTMTITVWAQATFKKNETVEIADVDNPGTWIKATVILFDDDGAYGHKGQYSMQAEGKPYNYNGWRKPGEIRRIGTGPGNDVETASTSKFAKGQRVEVVDTDAPDTWIVGTVILFDDDGAYGHKAQYSVQVDGKAYNYNGWRKGNEIRLPGQPGPIKPPTKDDPPVDPENNVPHGPLKVGDRVDVYLMGGGEGKNRGTILEINGNKIKVHPDGCAAYWDRDQEVSLVRPAATISNTDPEIKFLIGKWSMTVVGVSSAATAWGKTAGIQINSDGSFVWYQDGGRSPVKGRWESHAKIPNTKFGTEVLSGILIKDAKGQLWKITKRISPLDKGDHITATLMCSGENEIGTRAR